MESSTSTGRRLFCLIYDLDPILSATERCVVVKAAPLCNACGRVFMVFGTRLSHSTADLILCGLSQSGCFVFFLLRLSVALNQIFITSNTVLLVVMTCQTSTEKLAN